MVRELLMVLIALLLIDKKMPSTGRTYVHSINGTLLAMAD